MQDAIRDAVLPVWSSSGQALTPSHAAAITAILKRCTESVQAPLAAGRAGRAGLTPDPQIVQQVVEMGFSEARVQEALRRVRAPTTVRTVGACMLRGMTLLRRAAAGVIRRLAFECP
jgi:hypothetical protein